MNYKAHIFRQRQVGEREEVKLKIFGPDGTPIDLGGGGGGSKVFDGWSEEAIIPNNGEDVVIPLGGALVELEQGDVRTSAPAGIYVTKLRAMWGAGSALSLGAGQLILFHISADDTESVLCSLVMSPENNIGDMPLSDIHATGEKIDMGSCPQDGRLELRAMQTTDQSSMSLSTRVTVAKL